MVDIDEDAVLKDPARWLNEAASGLEVLVFRKGKAIARILPAGRASKWRRDSEHESLADREDIDFGFDDFDGGK